LLSYSTGWFQ